MSSTTGSFDSLPLDLLVDEILVLLPAKDLLSLSCTCRSLHSTIHDSELVWKRKIAKDYRFPTGATGRVAGFKTLYRKLRKPEVWVWGQNMNDRLGLDGEDQADLIDPVLSNFSEVPTPLRLRKAESIQIVDLQAGGWSFHGLDVNGNVWCWGTLDGSSGAWNPHPHRVSPKQSEVEPVMLRIRNLPQFKAISCGRSHAAGISDDGHIYEWHSWNRVAKLVSAPWEPSPGKRQRVLQICAGWDFSALLSSDGVVYFWREPTVLEVAQALDSQFDNLPQESSTGTVYDFDCSDRVIRCPDLPESEPNQPQFKDSIVKIACGEEFIICLTMNRKIYKLDISQITAPERNGPPRVLRQLQHHDDEMLFRLSIAKAFRDKERKWEYLPYFCEAAKLQEGLVNALPSVDLSDAAQLKITHISAQYRTFVAYSVENPSENQPASKKNSFVFFGMKTTGKDDKPEILPQLQRRGVIQVALGDYHYVALLSNGQVLTWGSYSQGALGLGRSLHPHRRLLMIGASDEPKTEDPDRCEYENGIEEPTAVQSFTGTEHYLAERVVAGNTSWNQTPIKVPPRYVFLVTAAGWHTGCLAFSLEDDEDLDYGLEVLEHQVRRKTGSGSDSEQDDEEEPPPLMFARPIFSAFRIGFAGRFMRGGARGGLLRRHRIDGQGEQGDGNTAEDDDDPPTHTN